MKNILLLIFIFTSSWSLASPFIAHDGMLSIGAVGIGDAVTPNSSSLLDIKSTTQGVLFPRMTSTQRNAISSPATGLMVWDTTVGTLYQYNGSTWASVGGTSSPLTTKGDIYIYSTTNDRLPVGSDGFLLSADSTQTTGLRWISPPATSPLTTKGDLYGYSTTNARVPIGTAIQDLKPDSSTTNGVSWQTVTYQFLQNPSFEWATLDTGWTYGTGASGIAETTIVRHGTKSLNITLSSTNGVALFQDVTPAAQLQGINLEHSMWVKTSLTTLQVCARNAAASIGTCANVASDNIWHQYIVNYPGPASGSVGVGLYTTSSTSGTVYVDDAYVGTARNVGTVQQATFFGGMEQAGATGCTYSENTSTGLNDFKDLGTGSGCNAWTTTGPVTAVGTNDHRLTANNLAAGVYKIEIASNINASASAVCNFRLSDGTNTYQPQMISNGSSSVSAPNLTFSVPYSTPQSSVTFKLQASDNASVTCSLDASAAGLGTSWKIYYFPTSAQQVVRVDNSNIGWTAYTPSTTGLGTPTITEAWYKRSGDSIFLKGRITLGTTTATTASIGFPNSYTVDSTKETSTAIYGGQVANQSASTVFSVVATGGDTGISFGSISGTSGISKAQGTILGASGNVVSYDTGPIPITGWTENQNAPLLVGSVTSNTSGIERIERSFICGNSACGIDISAGNIAVSSQSGSWLGTPTRSGAGAYAVPFASGMFSAAPSCSCTVDNTTTSNNFLCSVSITSSQVNVRTSVANTGTATDPRGFHLLCMGPR